MDYEKGQRFQLKQHLGYRSPSTSTNGVPNPGELHPDAQYEEFLQRHYPIFEGQIGTVVDVVPPEVDGAGNHEEEHVVLQFEAHRLVDHNEGEVIHEVIEGHPGRTVSFTQVQMDEWFDKVPVGAIESAMAGGTQTLPEENVSGR